MKRKKRSIQEIIFYDISLTTMLVFLIVLITVFVVMMISSVRVLKKSRLDILKQMQERNTIVNDAMQFVADDLYSSCAKLITSSPPDNYDRLRPEILDIINNNNKMLNKLNMYPNVIILMKDNYSITSGDITKTDLSQIAASYWYIDNMSKPQKSLWTSRYYIAGHKTNMEICYAKSLTGADGEYLGIIIVSVSTDYLKEACEYMPDEGDGYCIYILDENGKAISHTYSTLLGTHIHYMPYFWNHYGKNTSRFDKTDIGIRLFSNIYSSKTGWTIVEEIPLLTLTSNFTDIIWLASVLLCFCFILSIAVSYILSKKIAQPIVAISRQMAVNECAHIDFQTSYKEVLVLSTVYNGTVDKMHALIKQVQQEEQEKMRFELSFLQAQINPHFLHNTLFSIKCLIEMNNGPKASIMLKNLIRLLKVLVATNKDWITIEEEISYLENYVSLMQNRYEDRNITLNITLPPELKSAIIPRLLLQPVVENSIFHGFDDNCNKGIIHINFQRINDKLIIRIMDNGKGMTNDELNALWSGSAKSKNTFNQIGLINIKQRIKLLYGDNYGISVVSEPGQGTETILNIGLGEVKTTYGKDNGCR